MSQNDLSKETNNKISSQSKLEERKDSPQEKVPIKNIPNPQSPINKF